MMSDDTSTPDEELALTADAVLENLEALKAENAALKDQLLRVAADAENTKRRAEREANDARAFAIQKFATDLLGVADNLGRALSAQPTGDDGPVRNFVVGVEMIEKDLLGAFERNGLKRLNPGAGDKFDPHLHQAVMEQPSTEVQGGEVIQTLQVGYELFGRVVRPAMVVVAARGSGPVPEAGPGASVDTRA